MRRQTKEMIKRIHRECNMTPAQRNKAILDEQIERFIARGGKIKRVEASPENFESFVNATDVLAVNDYLMGV